MKAQDLGSPIRARVVSVALASLAVIGFACGRDKPLGSLPAVEVVVPTTPMPVTGQAHLAGVVRDGNGAGVMGAAIKIAETDATTMTDATGAYALAVPADSTLTLFTTAMGYAPSFRESIVLADTAAVSGFDLTLLSVDDLARLDGFGPPAQVANRGLMAMRLHSLSSTCTTAGAKVSVWPPLAATVVYTRPSDTGGLDEPDPTLAGVQAGVHVDVWLAGAIPPGNLFQITIDQPGCTLAAAAPSMGGVQLTGLRHVDVQSYSEADFFLQ